MILFFSGTGNSRYVARRLGKLLQDDVQSINQALRQQQTGAYRSQKPYVVVSPVYAWQLPRLVRDFLLAARLEGSRQIYFILTCGSGAGNAQGGVRALCRQKHLVLCGVAPVVMPENYIAMFPVPGPEESARIIQKAEPLIDRLAQCIRAGLPFPHHAAGPLGRLLSGPVNRLFYRFQVSARGFRVTDACTGCGLCQRLCPLRNIRLEQGRPVWGERCTHCMACICACPAQAIEYKNHSQGKPRYYLK